MQAQQISKSMHAENELVRLAGKGDEGAFNRLVNLWYKRIFNYALKQCNSESLAGDIAQKTFISVFRNLKNLKEESSFKPWLYRIATNYCYEEGRRLSKSKTVSLSYSADSDVGSVEGQEAAAKGYFFNPERSYAQQEIERLLFTCLEILPDEQRSVVIMKEYEGMKFREIAAALDTSENTIKTWLYRGLKQLRKELEERNITKEALSYEL